MFSPRNDSSCVICESEFSVTRLRHKCSACGALVCVQCSGSKLRITPTGPKERVCDLCARELRASHSEELEETADVRQQINENLKQLLREKYEKIEELKIFLIQLIESEPYLQEAPESLDSPSRFSSELGPSRINFSSLVDFVDQRLQMLVSRASEIREAIERDSTELSERRRNFEFLKERTNIAENEAIRANELIHQRNRLKETFREQSATIRSLQDRAEMVENQFLSRGLGGGGGGGRASNLLIIPPPPIDVVEENEYFGDKLVGKIFPCLG